MSKRTVKNYHYEMPWQAAGIGAEVTELLMEMRLLWKRLQEKQKYCLHLEVYSNGDAEDGEAYLCKNCGLSGYKEQGFPPLPDYCKEGTPRNVKKVFYEVWSELYEHFNPTFRGVVNYGD